MAYNATVTISAGHGYGSQSREAFDPGADSKWVSNEGTVVIGFSTRIARDLAALGIPTFYRNKGLYFMADDDAAKFDSEWFYEFHLNAGGGKGSEVWIDETPSPAERRGALDMLYALTGFDNGFYNRGVKKNNWAVLRDHPSMNSMLVELFFADSSTDVAKFNKNVNKIELRVVNAIIKQLGRKPVRYLPRNTVAGRARLASRKYLKIQ